MATPPALSTPELRERLRRHYIKPGAPLPGGIFLPEVGWNGRAGGGCDALYVGFTSSSGRLLVGHELKISRADWVSEMNKPGKADSWADQCHQWWLVVSDPEIVRDGELPPGWGLMVPGRSRTRMAISVPARTRTDHVPSWEATRSIMARYDTLRAEEIGEARRRAHVDAGKDVADRVEREVARRQGLTREVERAMELVRLLQEHRTYLPDDKEIPAVAEAVVEVLAGKKILDSARRGAQDHLRELHRAIEGITGSYQYRQLTRLLEDAAGK